MSQATVMELINLWDEGYPLKIGSMNRIIEVLRDALAHVTGELSMFDHGEPEGAFEDCEQCEVARQLLLKVAATKAATS